LNTATHTLGDMDSSKIQVIRNKPGIPAKNTFFQGRIELKVDFWFHQFSLELVFPK
jgi:hypothetical protein